MLKQGKNHSPRDEHKAETTLRQKGMKNHSPANPDASMTCKGPSVDADATRKEVARSHSLGPREA